MGRIPYHFIYLLFLFFSSCVHQELPYKPPLENEGEVYLYLQPMPQASQKLRFIMEGIAARREDGSQIPLSPALTQINGAALLGTQKLLASGFLPPGLYSGVSIKIHKAFISGEEGESALHVFEDPVYVAHPFRVTRKIATALFLSLDASAPITDGVFFRPVFSLTEAGRQLINLTGYVSNANSNIISVFNKKTMRITGVIATGGSPKGMVLDQNRRRAYVAVSGDDAVAVIDVLEGRVINQLALNFGDEPTDLALTPDGRMLLSVNYDSNTVSLIDAISLFEENRIRVGDRPTSVVIDPSGSRAFITNSQSNTVSVIDLNRKSLIATLAVAPTPLRATFNRNGDSLYVISRDSPNLTVLDPSGLTANAKIFSGVGSISIVLDRQTNLIYVGNRFGQEISIIEPRSLMFIDAIGIEGIAAFMTIDNEENSLFVVLPDRRVLQKFNLTGKKIISEIEVGEGAYAVVVMGER